MAVLSGPPVSVLIDAKVWKVLERGVSSTGDPYRNPLACWSRMERESRIGSALTH